MAQETTGSEASESSTELPIEPTTSAIEKTDSTRDERASELVDRSSLWSGAAGFIPVPLVDNAVRFSEPPLETRWPLAANGLHEGTLSRYRIGPPRGHVRRGGGSLA